jgi:hypothetical protein
MHAGLDTSQYGVLHPRSGKAETPLFDKGTTTSNSWQHLAVALGNPGGRELGLRQLTGVGGQAEGFHNLRVAQLLINAQFLVLDVSVQRF